MTACVSHKNNRLYAEETKTYRMRIITFLFPLLLLACGTKQNISSTNPAIDFVGVEATVETHVISRGSYQHLLVVEGGEHEGRYLPEKDMAGEYCEDGLKVKVDAEVLKKSGTVYKPGPTDKPEKDFEVPIIRILAIQKM